MERIYHHHDKWEEVKFNMYGNYNHKRKQALIQTVIQYFRQRGLVEHYMQFVIDTFKHSCEHNLTNPSMNKIAWLGQASVAVYRSIPRDITMIAWNFLDEMTQKQANAIAQREIERWTRCQNNI